MLQKRILAATAVFAVAGTIISAVAPQHVSAATYKAIGQTNLAYQTPANHSFINTILNKQLTIPVKSEAIPKATVW